MLLTLFHRWVFYQLSLSENYGLLIWSGGLCFCISGLICEFCKFF
jgi:hypothetical protein